MFLTATTTKVMFLVTATRLDVCHYTKTLRHKQMFLTATIPKVMFLVTATRRDVCHYTKVICIDAPSQADVLDCHYYQDDPLPGRHNSTCILNAVAAENKINELAEALLEAVHSCRSSYPEYIGRLSLKAYAASLTAVSKTCRLQVVVEPSFTLALSPNPNPRPGVVHQGHRTRTVRVYLLVNYFLCNREGDAYETKKNDDVGDMEPSPSIESDSDDLSPDEEEVDAEMQEIQERFGFDKEMNDVVEATGCPDGLN
ncbi:hypothetical protein HDU87_004283 [Geranomyces variabilis]|uniref:Uncharacterized protein n=1 Tax=Geranomyces variabilis TaxID=109894 RepID=A0AAD5TJX4_9FUNG|nr:hypothetical protein HDU87_004283 [Geranomyces variabilis]